MTTFSINDKALEEIRQIIGESGCIDPVVTLSETAPVNVHDGTKAAFRAGMNEKELQTMAARIDKEFPEETLVYSLAVGTFERKECRPEDLMEICGVAFAMPIYLRDALREYCLIFEAGQFLLQSADETASNLRSIKSIAKWFNNN